MNLYKNSLKNVLCVNAIPLLIAMVLAILNPQTNIQKNTDDRVQIKSKHTKIYIFPKGEKEYYQGHKIFDKLQKYNTKGLVTQSFQYKDDTLFSYINYYYDTSNLLLESKEFNSDNTLYLSIKYTHNKKGFVTRADYLRNTQKQYDDHRNPVEVEFEKYYKNLFTYIVYVNDFMGNVLEKRYYTDDDRLSFKYTFKYDFRYNKIEIKFYNNKGSVSWRKKMKYNKEGLLTQYKLYMNNRPALLSKFRYQLDSNKNWIKRVETRKLYNNFFAYDIKDNTIVTENEIEYY